MLVVILCCGAIIASWEVFNLHPQLSVGSFHSMWTGFRNMEFTSGSGSVPLINGQTETRRDYNIGPVKIEIIRVSGAKLRK